MRNVHASPVFIPMDGFQSSFEVVFPWKTVAQLSQPLQRSSPAGTAAAAHSNSNSNMVVSSVIFVAENSTQVDHWMSKISNVFADFDMGAPPASDEAEEEDEADSAGVHDPPRDHEEEEEEEEEEDPGLGLRSAQRDGDGGPTAEEGAGQGAEQEGHCRGGAGDDDDDDDDDKNLLFVGDVADEFCMGEMLL